MMLNHKSRKIEAYQSTAICLLLFNFLLIAQANADKGEPKVPFVYSIGYQKFQQNCKVCHGKWGEGSKQGPPLMHSFYVPSHHSDDSFYRAALHGVKAHHWQFGDMPKIQGITVKDMDAIIPYIRWLQRDRGIIH